jgi:glutaredoxin 2
MMYRIIGQFQFCFPETLEKLTYDRLIVFRANILSEAQNGFREKKSTETATQSFLESTQEASTRVLHVIGTFVDLTKAYNVINHDILIDKLNLCGIRGKSNLRFKSYLAQGKQHVEINQCDS